MMKDSSTPSRHTKTNTLPFIKSIQTIREQLRKTRGEIASYNIMVNNEIRASLDEAGDNFHGDSLAHSRVFPSVQYNRTKVERDSNINGKLSTRNQIYENPDDVDNNNYYTIRCNLAQPVTNFKIIRPLRYFPPACSGYDMANISSRIFIYGGISCTTQLKDGLKQYFYEYSKGKWMQVKPASMYSPMPRYGHTLTPYNSNYLLLFGGVSEYKQKLKDRCFYSDLWVYSMSKNLWKIVEFPSGMIQNRKSHSAAVYKNYYLVSGGIDDSEEVIDEISWISVSSIGGEDGKHASTHHLNSSITIKSKWKSKKLEARYNHKIVVCQTPSKDYLAIFGGRNSKSDIIGGFTLYQLCIYEGDLLIKQGKKINCHPYEKIVPDLSPREFPIMTCLNNGIIILGGTGEENECVGECWFYNGDRNVLERLEDLNDSIDWQELRGAKGVSTEEGKQLFIMTSTNTHKCKAIEITMRRD